MLLNLGNVLLEKAVCNLILPLQHERNRKPSERVLISDPPAVKMSHRVRLSSLAFTSLILFVTVLINAAHFPGC